MIVFELSCSQGHRFEGWFGSSSEFADQQERGLVSCPTCGDEEVAKAPMAPAVPAKENSRKVVSQSGNERDAAQSTEINETQPVSNVEMPPAVTKALETLAKAQARALEKSTWVGKSFADRSRAMHYGEQDQEVIHGEATPEQAQDLLDEGISVSPLPFPIAPPEDLN